MRKACIALRRGFLNFGTLAILGVICLVVAATLVFNTYLVKKTPPAPPSTATPSPHPSPTPPATQTSNYSNCDSELVAETVSGPFRKIDDFNWGGEVTINGTIVSKEIYSEFSEKLFEFVYLRVPSQQNGMPESEFFSYYNERAKQNSGPNLADGQNILFKIGELETNNSFSSFADISPQTKQKILTSITNGESVRLKLKIPVYTGSGAPSNFSFACEIESL